MSPVKSRPRGNQRERGKWAPSLNFPANAASPRPGSAMGGAAGDGIGTVLILPVVRIERQIDETGGGRGPEQGAAAGRRRRRRP
jgi:hypothetical protein